MHRCSASDIARALEQQGGIFISAEDDGEQGRTRAGQRRAGQGRAVQGRAGQGRAGQGRAGQGSAGSVQRCAPPGASRRQDSLLVAAVKLANSDDGGSYMAGGKEGSREAGKGMSLEKGEGHEK